MGSRCTTATATDPEAVDLAPHPADRRRPRGPIPRPAPQPFPMARCQRPLSESRSGPDPGEALPASGIPPRPAGLAPSRSRSRHKSTGTGMTPRTGAGRHRDLASLIPQRCIPSPPRAGPLLSRRDSRLGHATARPTNRSDPAAQVPRRTVRATAKVPRTTPRSDPRWTWRRDTKSSDRDLAGP